MAEGYCVTIRAERDRQGLSQDALAQLAGMSRRHLASLEKGANVSVSKLRAVMQALGISDIDLGDGLTAHNPALTVAPVCLLPFADGIAREAARLTAIEKDMRAFARTGVGKSTSSDTPSQEVVSDEVGQLVDLMLSFARNAAALTARCTMKTLERDVSELLKRSNTA